MASDDMHVVMYKILAYLYACMKDDATPDKSMYSHKALGVNEGYWNSIMAELSRRKLVKGIDAKPMMDKDYVTIVNPRITMEGVEFLMENSMMRKARDFLISIKAAVPFA